MMKWTTEKPTEPGCYCWTNNFTEETDLISVEQCSNQLWGFFIRGGDNSVDELSVNSKWYGPIPESG